MFSQLEIAALVIVAMVQVLLAVGNLDYAASLASSSSRGPAADGRIKPDICAQGTNVYSTYPNYTYNSITGTSMSCPGISGVLAQLYQAYKENNNNTNPSSGLMKCILLNSADADSYTHLTLPTIYSV